MIYADATNVPADFDPLYETVGCFCNSEGKFLLLQYVDDRREGGRWGVPAGKVEKGESLVEAMQRELKEETGIAVEKTELEMVKAFFIRYPDHDFAFHAFVTTFSQRPDVVIAQKEHKNYKWVTHSEALRMDLIQDAEGIIEYMQQEGQF